MTVPATHAVGFPLQKKVPHAAVPPFLQVVILHGHRLALMSTHPIQYPSCEYLASAANLYHALPHDEPYLDRVPIHSYRIHHILYQTNSYWAEPSHYNRCAVQPPKEMQAIPRHNLHPHQIAAQVLSYIFFCENGEMKNTTIERAERKIRLVH